jgi:undecaprenyl-diphosphatase
MNLWQAAVLGLVQGITQVLPVSWTCHRLLLADFMGGEAGSGAAIEGAAAVGVLVALALFLAGDLARAGRGWAASLRHRIPADGEGARLGWGLLLASLPTAAAVLLLQWRPLCLDWKPLAVAGTSTLFALLLGWSQRQGDGRLPLRLLSPRGALVLGLAQLLALLPGSSRLGVVVTAALLLGMSRREAARFGLLLAVPTGLAMLLPYLAGLRSWTGGFDELLTLAAAAVGAALAAYLGSRLLLAWLGRGGFGPLVGYRLLIAAGLAISAWL